MSVVSVVRAREYSARECSAVQCSAVQLCRVLMFRFGAIDCATVEREGIHTVATGDGVAKYPWLTLVSPPR